MGQVVRLADRMQRSSARRASPKPLGASAYYCTRCEADWFRLYPGGAVQCASCGAQMENLVVGEPAAAGSEKR
ncbi:MAG: hypothetical protein ACREUO_09795 [Burkholderiales bacterium]